MSAVINSDTVRIVRSVYGLSCNEMGALIGVSGRMVSYIESGERSLTPSVRTALSEEFSLTPEKLDRIFAVYSEFKPKGAAAV